MQIENSLSTNLEGKQMLVVRPARTASPVLRLTKLLRASCGIYQRGAARFTLYRGFGEVELYEQGGYMAHIYIRLSQHGRLHIGLKLRKGEEYGVMKFKLTAWSTEQFS